MPILVPRPGSARFLLEEEENKWRFAFHCPQRNGKLCHAHTEAVNQLDCFARIRVQVRLFFCTSNCGHWNSLNGEESFILLARGMGCVGSRQKVEETLKKIRKPKPWKHSEPITRAQLVQMREEFWDTAPHYGGRKEIWDALRAATEADLTLAQAIVDGAGIIVQNTDLTICYDERGAKYELPKYVLSEPTNMIRNS